MINILIFKNGNFIQKPESFKNIRIETLGNKTILSHKEFKDCELTLLNSNGLTLKKGFWIKKVDNEIIFRRLPENSELVIEINEEKTPKEFFM